MFPWEDISENVTSYGKHNWAYTVTYRQLQFPKSFGQPNGFTNLAEILNLDNNNNNNNKHVF